MHKLQAVLKPYLQVILMRFRHEARLTQEQTAAMLQISVRSYSDLERGRSGFSAVTLMLFLDRLPDDRILETVHGFRPLADEMEKKEAA